jgi:hypothetical protein
MIVEFTQFTHPLWKKICLTNTHTVFLDKEKISQEKSRMIFIGPLIIAADTFRFRCDWPITDLPKLPIIGFYRLISDYRLIPTEY